MFASIQKVRHILIDVYIETIIFTGISKACNFLWLLEKKKNIYVCSKYMYIYIILKKNI